MGKIAFISVATIIGLASLTGCSSSNNEREAKVLNIAEEKAIEVYGEEQIESQKPLKANLEHGIWTVQGYLPPNTLGGTVEVKISDETLEILSITHYQ